MTALVAQIGARRSYAVPRALHSLGLLERLVTDACAEVAPWRWMRGVASARGLPAVAQRLLERCVVGIPPERITGLPLFALSAFWDQRFGERQTDRWARRNAAFGRLVVRSGFGDADTVYAFNGAALEIFRAARRVGLRTVLDQTSAPWRWNSRLLREEARRWPGWEAGPAEVDESGWLSDREEEEWVLADRIVCGSSFAASAVAQIGGPRERCVMVPHAGPDSVFRTTERDQPTSAGGGRLRVLFVGTLQLRKGVQYLLEAARKLRGEGVTIRIIGPSRLSVSVMKELHLQTEVIGAVQRSQLAAHYAWADVFVLPTLSEGSANVCYEAMSAALPVITTPNAGSVIEDGRQGLIVPIRDSAAIVEAIQTLAQDWDFRAKLARAARDTAKMLGQQHYASRLGHALVAS